MLLWGTLLWTIALFPSVTVTDLTDSTVASPGSRNTLVYFLHWESLFITGSSCLTNSLTNAVRFVLMSTQLAYCMQRSRCNGRSLWVCTFPALHCNGNRQAQNAEKRCSGSPEPPLTRDLLTSSDQHTVKPCSFLKARCAGRKGAQRLAAELPCRMLIFVRF